MKDKIILLVEDNPDDVKLTLRALKKKQYQERSGRGRGRRRGSGLSFGTGKFAGRNTGILPQVVLLDLKMPKMDGLEVLHRIRSDERTRVLPVVILTTSSEDKDRVDSYKLGANSYIRKPVDFNQFVAAVQQLGLYWLVLNESP